MRKDRYEIAVAIREIEAEYQKEGGDLFVFLFHYFFPMIETRSDYIIDKENRIFSFCKFRSSAKPSAHEHKTLFQTHLGIGAEKFGKEFSAFVDIKSAKIPDSCTDEEFSRLRRSFYGEDSDYFFEFVRTNLVLQDVGERSVRTVIEEKSIMEFIFVTRAMELFANKSKIGVIRVIKEIEATYKRQGGDLFTFLFSCFFPVIHIKAPCVVDAKGRYLSICEFLPTGSRSTKQYLDELAEHFDLCYYDQTFDAYVDVEPAIIPDSCMDEEYGGNVAHFGETEDYTWKHLKTSIVLRDADFCELIEKEQIRQFVFVTKVMELFREITAPFEELPDAPQVIEIVQTVAAAAEPEQKKEEAEKIIYELPHLKKALEDLKNNSIKRNGAKDTENDDALKPDVMCYDVELPRKKKKDYDILCYITNPTEDDDI